jgi:hypothetical protein
MDYSQGETRSAHRQSVRADPNSKISHDPIHPLLKECLAKGLFLLAATLALVFLDPSPEFCTKPL